MDYRLKEIIVSPRDLLLDPNNPRLRKAAGLERSYTDGEIASPQLQERLFRAMRQKEHEVAELSESIKHHGYLNIDSIFVHRLQGIGQFLVIEGNRRTTAIKLLLQAPDALSPHTRQSLQQIPVKELVTPNGRPSAQITDLILAIRHIYGVKEWQPMQRAHTIFRTYMRILAEEAQQSVFSYDTNLAGQVGTIMNVATKAVRKALMIYRVYHQLQNNNYPVRSDHFSLIDLAVSNRTLSKEFFGIDRLTFEFSDQGAESFFKLCIQENAPIQNPQVFRQFAQVFREGTPHELTQVVDGQASVEAVYERIARRLERKAASLLLSQARELLQDIEVSDIRGTAIERLEAERIQRLLDKLSRAHAARSDGD